MKWEKYWDKVKQIRPSCVIIQSKTASLSMQQYRASGQELARTRIQISPKMEKVANSDKLKKQMAMNQ